MNEILVDYNSTLEIIKEVVSQIKQVRMILSNDDGTKSLGEEFKAYVIDTKKEINSSIDRFNLVVDYKEFLILHKAELSILTEYGKRFMALLNNTIDFINSRL